MAEDACKPWYEDDTVVIPALLRHARTAYGAAMRAAVAAIGCDDIPRNGMYVIGGLAMNATEGGADGLPLGQLVKELGVSKQAAGQLVDTLVLRGYLERTVDAGDRRKLTVSLTPRGQAAAAAQRAARERIDAALKARVGAETVAAMRRGLGVLCVMGQETEGDGDEH